MDMGFFGGSESSFPWRAKSPATLTELAECLKRFKSLSEPQPLFFNAFSPPTSLSMTSWIRYKFTHDLKLESATKRSVFATAGSTIASSAIVIVLGWGLGRVVMRPSGSVIVTVTSPISTCICKDSWRWTKTSLPPAAFFFVYGGSFEYFARVSC